MEKRRQLGNQSESLAKKFLAQNGYTVVRTNFSCSQGEIDLIVRDKQMLIFAEVRSKTNQHYGEPLETVNWKKQQKIKKTAQYFLYHHQEMQQYYCRFDVISIVWQDGAANLQWIPDAFR